MTKEEFLNLKAGDYVKIGGMANDRGCFATVKKASIIGVVVTVEITPGEIRDYHYKTLKVVTEKDMEEAVPGVVTIEKSLNTIFDRSTKEELIELIVRLVVEGLYYAGRERR